MVKKVLWSNKALQKALRDLDVGYKYVDISYAYSIPRSTLRDYYLCKRTSRKMDRRGVFTNEEDEALCIYILNITPAGFPLTLNRMKEKATEMIQERPTSFKKAMLGRSLLRWFSHKHLEISLRFLQALEQKRAKTVNPSTIKRFFDNLSSLYQQYQYKAY